MKKLHLFMFLIFFACNGDDLKLVQISGDSVLKIINDISSSVNIFFDDQFIGDIDSEESRIWDAPSGNHTIKATSLGSEAYSDSFNFVDGDTIELTLYVMIKSGMVEHIVLKDKN